jgi:ribosomal protein L7/L12
MNASDDEVLSLISRDRKLDAIKLLRETRRLGLSEAKAEVERLSATRPAARPPSAPAPSRHIDAEVRRLAQSGQRIAAIKLLRERNRLGLKQAKDLLDATVPAPAGSSIARSLALAAVVAIAGAVVAAVWLLGG